MAEQVRRDLQLVDFLHQLHDGRLEPREFIVDCLTNLRHVADEAGVDFDSALASSDNHFLAELARSDNHLEGGTA